MGCMLVVRPHRAEMCHDNHGQQHAVLEGGAVVQRETSSSKSLSVILVSRPPT